MFRAGDQVSHEPSGECWVLAFGDMEDGTGKVSPCGWPETLANATDCNLVQAASDDEHSEMIKKWAERKFVGFEVRKSVCRSYAMKSTPEKGQ